MAYEIPVQLVPFQAGADLSNAQFRFVKLDNTGKIVLATNDAPIIGILQDAPAAGAVGSVMTFGISRVVAGDSFNVGALLTASADGKAGEASSGQYVAGIALEAATAADQVVTALIVPGLFTVAVTEAEGSEGSEGTGGDS